MIELVARLFGLSAYEAAQKLAADFGLDADKPPSAAACTNTQRPAVRAFRQDEVYCQRVLCDYLRLLEEWKVRYAPSSPEEEYDDRFVEACQMMDYVESLADILVVGELKTRVKVVQSLLKEGTISSLEAHLNQMKEGEEHGEIREAV